MLLDIQIEGNKNKFIDLVNSIEREGFLKDKLIQKLESSDFFTAPASTKYHNAYKGGLCEHSLNVYDNIVKINEMKNLGIDSNTLKIVSLFHDLAKMNFYEVYFQNKKRYHAGGTKKDEGGYFDWETVSAYKVKESSDRFVFGSHEQTSEFMLRNYCPLTYEESIAVLHHHGGRGWDSAQDNIGEVFQRYPIALILHMADMFSAYLDENRG